MDPSAEETVSADIDRKEIRDLCGDRIRISEIGADTDLDDIADVIRRSFATVARRFGLTPANCPAHPAFLEPGRITELREKGSHFLGLNVAGRLAGVVAVEIRDDLCYIEKLSVLPECRHRGFGKRLMDAAEDYAVERGCHKASIGIIDENTVLKDWYADMGFGITAIERFEHLPFAVCMMEKSL